MDSDTQHQLALPSVLRQGITTVFIRRPAVSLLVTAGVCLLLWVLGWNFETRKGIDSVLDARGGQREVFERARDVGDIERTLFVDIEGPRIFSTRGLTVIRAVTESFLDTEHVASAKSLTHSFMPVRRGLSFAFEPLIPLPPWSEDQLDRLEAFSLNHPLIRNTMISGDGRRALIAIEYQADAFERSTTEDLQAEAQRILDTFEQDGFRARMISLPFGELEIREAVTADVRLLGVAALLLAIIVLRVAFLGWRLAATLLLAHLLYLSILPGLFGLGGYQPEPFAIAIFPLLGAIQLTLLAHIGAAFVRATTSGCDRKAALGRAISETGKACLFATLTTMAGFLALTVSETGSVRELGLWGAAGVAAGFLFTFGPALSILALARRFGRSSASMEARLRRLQVAEGRWKEISGELAGLVRRRGRWLQGGAALLIVATAPGLVLLKPDVRIESFLPRGSQIQEAVLLADAEYGGLQFAQIDFDSGRRGGITNREFLEYVWRAHQQAEAIPEVTAVYSYPQILTILNQVWQGGDADALLLPEELWLLRMFTAGLEAFNLPLLGAVADPERQTAFMILRMPSLPSERYLEIVEEIVEFSNQSAIQGVTVQAGGMVHEFLASDQAVVRAQLLSSVAVLGAVAILLLLLWRFPVLALKGLAVTILPVASVLGLAGYAGVTLNAITVMAGAIAAGIAVDDAVHFITCWRDAKRRLGSDQAAIEEAIFIKGPPILFTSIILIGAFLLLGLSSFQPVGLLGLMVAGSLLVTLPAILLVLPGMLARKRLSE